MRRFEYTHKFKPHTLKITKETILKPTISLLKAVTILQRTWRKYLYLYYVPRVLYIQKIIRGYLIKKKIGYIVLLFRQVKIKLNMLENIVCFKRKRRNYHKLLVNMKKKNRFNDLLSKLKLVQRNVLRFIYLQRAKRSKILRKAYLFKTQTQSNQSNYEVGVKIIINSISITKAIKTNFIKSLSKIRRIFFRTNFIKRKINVLKERKLLPVFSMKKIYRKNIFKRVLLNKQILITKSIIRSFSLQKKYSIKKKHSILNVFTSTKKLLLFHNLFKEICVIQRSIRRVLACKKLFDIKKAKEIRKNLHKIDPLVIKKNIITSFGDKNSSIIQKYLKNKLKKSEEEQKNTIYIKPIINLPFIVPIFTKQIKTNYHLKTVEILNKWINHHVFKNISKNSIKKIIEYKLLPNKVPYFTKKYLSQENNKQLRIIQNFVKKRFRGKIKQDFISFEFLGKEINQTKSHEEIILVRNYIAPFLARKYICNNLITSCQKPLLKSFFISKIYKSDFLHRNVEFIETFLKINRDNKKLKRNYYKKYEIAPFITKINISQELYLKRNSLIIHKYFSNKLKKTKQNKEILISHLDNKIKRIDYLEKCCTITKTNKMIGRFITYKCNKIKNSFRKYYLITKKRKLLLKTVMVKINKEYDYLHSSFKRWIQISRSKFLKKVEFY
jgi:hypothetical protein